MTGRLSMVSRGKFIDHVDNALSNPDEALLRAHEGVTLDQLVELGEKIRTIPNDQHVHTNIQFLGDDPTQGFFPPSKLIPDFAGKSAILTSAYIQALRVALYSNPDAAPDLRVPRKVALPIKTYWITGVDYFEIYVSLSNSDSEVHVLLMTPDPENVPKKPSIGTPENMWAIATDDRIKHLYEEIPKEYGAAPPFSIKQAQCLKLWGY
jgi:hypothetical protein